MPVGASKGKDAPPVEDLRMRELSIKGGLEAKGRLRGRGRERSTADIVPQGFSIKGGAAATSVGGGGGGFSILGAAKKHTPPDTRVTTPKSASLLDRIGR